MKNDQKSICVVFIYDIDDVNKYITVFELCPKRLYYFFFILVERLKDVYTTTRRVCLFNYVFFFFTYILKELINKTFRLRLEMFFDDIFFSENVDRRKDKIIVLHILLKQDNWKIIHNLIIYLLLSRTRRKECVVFLVL